MENLNKNGQKLRWTKEEIGPVVKQCLTWTDVMRSMGFAPTGGMLRVIKRYVEFYKIDTSHFQKYRTLKKLASSESKRVYTDEELFSVNSPANLSSVRSRYKRLNPPVCCAICKVGNVYNGQPLTLQIDHIDGDSLNQSLENLRYICPNCHSQTATYGRKVKTRDIEAIRKKRMEFVKNS